MKTYNYKGYEVYLSFSKYAIGGRISLILLEVPDGLPFAVATVNIPDADLNESEIIIKDYSENEGMAEWIEENNIGKPTGKLISSGFVNCPVFKLMGDIL